MVVIFSRRSRIARHCPFLTGLCACFFLLFLISTDSDSFRRLTRKYKNKFNNRSPSDFDLTVEDLVGNSQDSVLYASATTQDNDTDVDDPSPTNGDLNEQLTTSKPLADNKRRKPKEMSAREVQQEAILSSLPKEKGCTKYQKADMRKSIAEVAINNTIFLAAFIDKGYLHMAENFYLTSIRSNNITNVLFFCIDESACRVAWDKCIPALLYVKHVAKDEVGPFETEAFWAKSRLKINLVKKVLDWGYKVMLTDVDIWYFKNPLGYISCGSDCDIAVEKDNLYLNTGFNYIKPTKASRDFYNFLVKSMDEWKGPGDDQRIFNEKLPVFRNKTKLRMKVMDAEIFPVALVYFEQHNRLFPEDNPCQDCIIVHNNWLFGHPTKVYRFKEHHMWFVDDRGYYSNPETNYLMYEHPPIFPQFEVSRKWEDRALENALIIGNITGRVVILPRFTCENTTEYKCPLNSHYRIAAFDEQFGSLYRESTFLEHPLTSEQTKTSLSPLLRLTDISEKQEQSHTEGVTPSLYKFQVKGKPELSSDAIKDWLMPYQTFKVLRFYSLYYAHIYFSDPYKQVDFSKRLEKGLVRSDYEQRMTQG